MADVLVALDGNARTLHERREAASFARTTYEITAQRYEAGGVSQLALLDAQRRQLSASFDEISAMADRYVNSAALFQALGGGWWTAPPPTTVQHYDTSGAPGPQPSSAAPENPR